MYTKIFETWLDRQRRSVPKRVGSFCIATLLTSGAASAVAQQITFDGANLPCITYNIATAQQAGRPAQLTRTTNPQTINQNRQASCGGAYAQTVAQLNQQLGGVVMSCDEYAFASTTQGGAGSQSMIVPLIENNIQGGQLSGFYNSNNIGNGGNFTVATINVPQANQLNLGVVNGVHVCYGGN
ncbi:NucA/NucB deoxyribonuclease domain-containing protein [Rhizobium straminoryzae]|uniref:Deoxyribonuclease NucA/NucB domain-containing protein n=1 Tax=Rhizobium straminoryzae TaxID=1387186 RepID=A0A549T0A1_9HYPH|nr:NucA/NucB deoxyribonuclease domain-containing protein [Rhizobium straminoryzae]TRL35295.1 hypothetical protein FNA46_20470 [Rhizobium straminoryzae]